MAINRSLLSYIVPTLTTQVEVAATKSLAFILNKSAETRKALDLLLSDNHFRVEPIQRLTAEESLTPGARLDLVGYDGNGIRRLLVEAKFWASLGGGQASEYIKLLEAEGPGVLLFLCPETRSKRLWVEVQAQLESGEAPRKLEDIEAAEGLRVAVVPGEKPRRAMLISWQSLLDKMAAATQSTEIRSDILQLRDLAQLQDDGGFQPLTPDASAEDFDERDISYRKLIVDAVATGKSEGLLNVDRLSWGITEGYRRRFFSFEGVTPEVALGVEYTETRYEVTPLWLFTYAEHWHTREQPQGTIDIAAGKYSLTPIQVNTGAAHGSAVAELVGRMRNMRDVLIA